MKNNFIYIVLQIFTIIYINDYYIDMNINTNNTKNKK